jgi:hypothetical protein
MHVRLTTEQSTLENIMWQIDKRLIKTVTFLKDCVWVDHKELTSRIPDSYENEDLTEDAKIVAAKLSTANIFDFLSSQGAFYFLCSSSPIIIGLPLSLALNFSLLFFKNKAGVGVARKRDGTFWTRANCMLALIALSSVSCVGSFIGNELVIDEKGLAEFHAKQLIDEKIEGLEKAIKEDRDEYNKAYSECNAGKIQIDNYRAEHSKEDFQKNQYYTSLYGKILEKPTDHSPESLCEKADRSKEKLDRNPNLFLRIELIKLQSAADNKLEFLKTGWPEFYKANYPDSKIEPKLYEKYFTSDGKIESGSEAIKVATNKIYKELSTGNFASLGGSLFLSLINVFTTLAACGAVWAFPLNVDAMLSFDQSLTEEIRKSKDNNNEKPIK